ncbi:hypothetical protein GIB67_028297 [Kingdonia uniflora]|uniref:Response regulatory domain-containing protein n=1 Tax=Kingdonia uniflora TaxID=39325 RepID=A0A7J7MHL1_9MAGN|nr:hypothetical protein GIB67_028297 [Kingdonia uniflora]
MPQMDGFKLMEIIGLEMGIPVIMMSSSDDKNIIMKGVKHGACDYLVKPVMLKDLKNIWQHVIRKNRFNSNDLNVAKSEENQIEKSKKGQKRSIPGIGDVASNSLRTRNHFHQSQLNGPKYQSFTQRSRFMDDYADSSSNVLGYNANNGANQSNSQLLYYIENPNIFGALSDFIGSQGPLFNNAISTNFNEGVLNDSVIGGQHNLFPGVQNSDAGDLFPGVIPPADSLPSQQATSSLQREQMQDNYGASGYFLEIGGNNKRKHVETLKLTKVFASNKLESFCASQEALDLLEPFSFLTAIPPAQRECANAKSTEIIRLSSSAISVLNGAEFSVSEADNSSLIHMDVDQSFLPVPAPVKAAIFESFARKNMIESETDVKLGIQMFIKSKYGFRTIYYKLAFQVLFISHIFNWYSRMFFVFSSRVVAIENVFRLFSPHFAIVDKHLTRHLPKQWFTSLAIESDAEEAKTQENAKLQSAPEEMQLKFKETKAMLVKERETAKKVLYWVLRVKESVDALIKCAMQEIAFSQGKPVAAFTIYKCLLHWKSFEAEKTSVFDRLIQMIGSAIEVSRTSRGIGLRTSGRSSGTNSPNSHWQSIIETLNNLLATLKQNFYAGSSWDELKHIRQAIGFLPEALPAIRGTDQLGSNFKVFPIHFLNKDKRLR